jgi:hypothetical protein
MVWTAGLLVAGMGCFGSQAGAQLSLRDVPAATDQVILTSEGMDIIGEGKDVSAYSRCGSFRPGAGENEKRTSRDREIDDPLGPQMDLLYSAVDEAIGDGAGEQE